MPHENGELVSSSITGMINVPVSYTDMDDRVNSYGGKPGLYRLTAGDFDIRV